MSTEQDAYKRGYLDALNATASVFDVLQQQNPYLSLPLTEVSRILRDSAQHIPDAWAAREAEEGQ